MMGAFHYFYRGGTISRKLVILLVLVALGFPTAVMMSVSRSGKSTRLQDAIQYLAYRIFYVPAGNVYYYFEIFPDRVHYLHGRSIDKVARVFGLETFDTSNYVGKFAVPTSIDSIYYNAAFISDFNADFGLAGVIAGGTLVGVVMQAMHIYIVRQRKTIAQVACYAYLVVRFLGLHSASFPVILASDGAVLVLFLGRLFSGSRAADRLGKSPMSFTYR